MTAIRTLVIDDEPLIAEAHAAYVRRMPGFELAGVAHTGQDALRLLKTRPVDVVLLDFQLPDIHGLDLCRRIRSTGAAVDVIAVTSTRDLSAVRAAVSLGVVQYLLKPFTWRAMQDKLDRYARYRADVAGEAAEQSDIDRALGTLRGTTHETLPAGLTGRTRDAVIEVLRDGTPRSAGELADLIGASRVTARRYLEHLADTGVLDRRPRLGGVGRPEMEYTWRG